MAKKMKLTNLCKNVEENEKLESLVNKLESEANSFDFTTSGSTGKPKTLKFSREQLETSVAQTQQKFSLKGNQRFLCSLSLDYVAGKMMLVRAFLLGAELVFTGPQKNPLSQNVGSIDFAAFVPLQVDAILKNKSSRRYFKEIGTVIIGGAPLDIGLEKKLTAFEEVKIYHTYGMTETLTHVAVRKINNTHSTLYIALEGVVFKQDEDGCLLIKSPVLPAEWLSTTDVVRLYGNDQFEWLGRKDFIINSGGFKVQTEQVEQKLKQDIQAPLLITAVADEELGEKVVALIEGEEQRLQLEQIAEKLHRFEIPKAWYFVPKIPQKTNGKVDRLKAKELAESLSQSS